MRKRDDERGYISWHDAMDCWRACEREYGVHLALTCQLYHGKRGDMVFHYSLAIAVPQGEGKFKSLPGISFSYPDREYGSLPGALVGNIHRAGIQVERWREAMISAKQQTLPLEALLD